MTIFRHISLWSGWAAAMSAFVDALLAKGDGRTAVRTVEDGLSQIRKLDPRDLQAEFIASQALINVYLYSQCSAKMAKHVKHITKDAVKVAQNSLDIARGIQDRRMEAT